MKDVLMKIRRNREEYDKRIQVLRHDPSFTAEQKEEKARELWERALERHGRLLDEYHRKREETRAKLLHRSFRLKFAPEASAGEGEKDDRIFREGLKRARSLPEERLIEMLREACRVGDRPTALAVSHCAFEKGLLAVLDLASRLIPERRQALLDLIDFESRWERGLGDEIRFDPLTLRRPPQPPRI
jgi:hypothetical protein